MIEFSKIYPHIHIVLNNGRFYAFTNCTVINAILNICASREMDTMEFLTMAVNKITVF